MQHWSQSTWACVSISLQRLSPSAELRAADFKSVLWKFADGEKVQWANYAFRSLSKSRSDYKALREDVRQEIIYSLRPYSCPLQTSQPPPSFTFRMNHWSALRNHFILTQNNLFVSVNSPALNLLCCGLGSSCITLYTWTMSLQIMSSVYQIAIKRLGVIEELKRKKTASW